MPTEAKDQAEANLMAILDEVKARKIHLYQSVLKEPWIFFDVEGRSPGCFSLFDPAVKHWLSHYSWDKELGLLRSQELDRILSVLAGLAMATPVGKTSDPTLLRIIQSEPVVAVLLDYMHKQTATRLEFEMEKLWEVLSVFARERGMLQFGRRRFPGGSNVLSRLLRRFIPVFASLNIIVEIARSNGSKVTLCRLDDPEPQPSAEPSTANSSNQNNLSPEDDRNRRRASLLERKNRQLPRPNEGETSQ
jgi:hypothetical protein